MYADGWWLMFADRICLGYVFGFCLVCCWVGFNFGCLLYWWLIRRCVWLFSEGFGLFCGCLVVFCVLSSTGFLLLCFDFLFCLVVYEFVFVS